MILSIILILFFLIILYLFYGPICANVIKKNFFNKRTPSINKEIYLTFDDGPSKYTNELLDILAKYNVHATFFCVGLFVQSNKEVIKRMQLSGHEIELHSLKHKNALLQDFFETKMDLEKSLNIMDSLGLKVHFYRPPWGDANLATYLLLKKKNLKLFLWNVMAEDWEKDTSPKVIEDKLLKRVINEDIICLHDGRGKNEAPKKTIEALDKIIPIFLEKGYVFKLVKDYGKL